MNYHCPHPQHPAAGSAPLSEPPAVLMSPTAFQAIDLPGDQCRYIIITRPFWPIMSPGSLATRRGEIYGSYANMVAATRMAQACGRGFRSEDDWCMVFIIDIGKRAIYHELKKFGVNGILAPTAESMASSGARLAQGGAIKRRTQQTPARVSPPKSGSPKSGSKISTGKGSNAKGIIAKGSIARSEKK